MPANILSYIQRLSILRDKLQNMANQIWEANQFKQTSEQVALIEMWGKVKDFVQELVELNFSIESGERGQKELSDPDQKAILKARTDRDIDKANRKIKTISRIENAANALLSRSGKEVEEKKKRPEKKQDPSKPKQKKKEEKKVSPPAPPTPRKEEKPKPEIKKPVSPSDIPKGGGSYNDILGAILKAVKKFNRNIPAAQKAMFDAISEEVSRLDLYPDGRVRTTAKNLSILASIKNKMLRVIVTPEYRAEVRDFVKAFNEVTTLQNSYWKEQEATFKPRKILSSLRKQAITDTVNKLTESGIGVNVGERITEMLKASITTGGSYKKLTASLRDGLLNTEQKGYLDRYAKQVTIDGLNQYSAQYNNIVASDLGYTWYKYDNTDIDTTRPFCDAMTDQPYFHVSEIPRLLKADELYYTKDGVKTKVPLNPKTGLPNGMIPGTDASTFFVNRGGYNCGHQIRPLNERQVPQEVKDKVFATPEYRAWAAANKKQ